MNRFWKKRLPATLLALALVVGLMPSALAAHAHSWDSTWTRGETTHWHACSGCNEHADEAVHDFEEVSTTPATCYQSGLKTERCRVCGYEKQTTTGATGNHTYNESRWVSDNDSHWHACTTTGCTETTGKTSHTAKGEGTVTNPTCTAAGSISYTCEVCGQNYTRTGSPATGHSYVNGVCTRCNARDTSTVTVTFYNGSNTYATQSVSNGGKPSNPGTPAYPGTGNYTFLGWTTSNPGSSAAYTNQTYYTSSQITNLVVTANTTYYAIYEIPVIPTITYTAEPGESETFDPEDFNDAYQDAEDTKNDIRWVEFSVPSSYSSFEGQLFLNFGEDTQESLTRSQLNGSTFYYEDAEEGEYALESLSFVPEEDADEADVLTIDFTAYRSNNSYVEGYLVLEISEAEEERTITYRVDADDEAVFDRGDFNQLFQKEYSGNSVRYVEFSASVAYTNSDGVIYADYEGNDEVSFSRTELNRATFYYSDEAYGDYALSDLSFVTGGDFEKTLEIPFTAYYSSSRYVSGTLVLKFADEAGDIAYTVAPGEEVEFDPDDFNDYFQKEADTTYDLKYVTFTTEDTLNANSSGLVYYDYDGDDERSFNKSTLEDFYFYYDDADDGDYALDLLSFVAGDDFDETITLEFNAYYSANRQASGIVTITPDEEAKTISTAGDILYLTPYTTSVQLNANDFARFFEKQYPNSDFLYARINGVPETGGLYYNYYGTSAYGTTARLKLTAANCDDQNLYFSPITSSQYALTELTYVPSGTNYCALIPFTAYGANNRSVTGTVLISVSLRTVSEVYGVTPKDTSVSFPAPSLAAAVATATGNTPASIQLLRLPAATVGTIYVGSGTSRRATTEDLYGYSSGTWRMSQLRFVPASGYTGSVEIPYIAYDSDNKPVAAGSFCLGVVESMKRFSDVTSTVWCYKYVTELSAASVIDGYNDGTFKPDNTISYGAALKLVMLAAGYPEQAPTGESVFSGYLDKARVDGIVTRSNVDLAKPISRLQVAQLAAGALKLDIENLSSVKPFTDTADLHVQALAAAGVINGYFENGTSTYRPDNTLTRGQASAIVWRMLNYTK